MNYKLILPLIFCIALGACATKPSTNEPVNALMTNEPLLGRWEGFRDGKMQAVVTFTDEQVEIQYVERPAITQRHPYKVARENNKLVLYIRNITEPLYPVISGNELRLELSETDRRKVDVTQLAIMTYRKEASQP